MNFFLIPQHIPLFLKQSAALREGSESLASTPSTKVRTSSQLIEGEDYYYEDGLMVFTARYHLRRGYCCESGCRHCPYGENSNR
ncbi:MAG: hypothetical protein DMF61_18695 [Blastocatellia bacterium AA13]|nr:MAG: hypothetical protein DMF61_18695 [Blastocatellia bacterium AA13]